MRNFKFWCQKVLPLVYDDSLSYYELLCKVVDYLNKVIQEVNALGDDVTQLAQLFNQLKEYVDNYFNNLDVQEEIDKKLDEMVATGKFAELLTAYTKVRLNVAWFVEGELSSSNISEAILSALAISKYIYIPSGNYSFNCVITSDIDLELDKDCFITGANAQPALKITGKSVKISGGNVYSGDGTGRTMVANSESLGIIELYECKNNVISNINVPYSNFPNVFLVQDCVNTTFENITSNYTLLSAIHILYHCVNTVVRNCNFSNIYIPDKENTYYCYAVFTGARNLTDNFTPPDGLIYENNYVNHSEDTGLDTHGARNVIIRNNVISECNTAITAYNDNRRVTRPDNWTMNNVVIENNICISSYLNQYDNHPYTIFNCPGDSIGMYNLVIKNNVFKSSNNKQNEGLISLSKTVGIEFINNVLDGDNSVNYGLRLNVCHNITIKDNVFNNIIDTCINSRCVLGDAYNNTYNSGVLYFFPSSSFVYLKGVLSGYNVSMLEYGDVWNDDKGFIKLCSSANIRVFRDNLTIKTVSGVVSGDTCTVADNEFIPRQQITINGILCRVIEWVNSTTFKFYSNTAIADGTYDIVVLNAVLSETVKTPILLETGADLNTLSAGIYYSNGATLTNSLINKPSELTGLFTMTIDYYGTTQNPSYLSNTIINGSTIYSRLKQGGTYYSWFKYTGESV